MITITGATGHIGNVLVRKLRTQGNIVQAVIPPFEDPKSLQGLQVEKIAGDVRKRDTLISAFEGSKIVYHLAGIRSIIPGKEELIYQVNYEGTKNVIEACLTTGVERLVYTSSIHAFPETPHGTVIDETLGFDPEQTVSVYEKTKALASLAVQKAVKQQGLDAVIVCPTAVLGPYDFPPFSELGQFVISFANNKLFAVPISGGYDFVDVRDVAEGHILACEKGEKGEAYILAGCWASISHVIELLEDVTGVKPPSWKVPTRVAQMVAKGVSLYSRIVSTRPLFTEYSLKVLSSNSLTTAMKAQQTLGYSTRSLRGTLTDTVNWYNKIGCI
ncbi:MAG: SDR family oxidoreductase [Candidatus Korarchaeota archaeon]|nr:SDR family oxidoreductase [Candidatus Korarchaeota archaeon]NIU82955.1 NAD-dependent epimerase/dehydratase family protein [Candidatus Thorarchaeota archaeon]NIW13378.1 NAD-dependent epimerase/dehydratase family protein [Candidatus Thorarchaeota archaeon]NIW51478.1 NAD-dependent epimerase/dehydratase family protein [Candidatus Korarchaeota archaeon]